MKKSYFKEIMRTEVIEKIYLFADAFSLTLENWCPASSRESENRIVFYTSGIPSGYLDAKPVKGLNSLDTEMPFVLFSPLGRIEGSYLTGSQLFKYHLKYASNPRVEASGLFGVEGTIRGQGEYQTRASLYLEEDGERKISVSFKGMSRNYEVLIDYNGETFRVFRSGEQLKIEHSRYLEFNRKHDLARITVDLRSLHANIPVSFQFPDVPKYVRSIEMDKDDDFLAPHLKLALLDFQVIRELLKEHDARLEEFIGEVREKLTFLANGLSPVCLYDKIAHATFKDYEDEIFLAFSQAQDANSTLARNSTFNKMMVLAKEKRKH